ncbi:hypothetical protein D3C80_1746600 [compost metagenome]
MKNGIGKIEQAVFTAVRLNQNDFRNIDQVKQMAEFIGREFFQKDLYFLIPMYRIGVFQFEIPNSGALKVFVNLILNFFEKFCGTQLKLQFLNECI